jgi:hypothetical protein
LRKRLIRGTIDHLGAKGATEWPDFYNLVFWSGQVAGDAAVRPRTHGKLQAPHCPFAWFLRDLIGGTRPSSSIRTRRVQSLPGFGTFSLECHQR